MNAAHTGSRGWLEFALDLPSGIALRVGLWVTEDADHRGRCQSYGSPQVRARDGRWVLVHNERISQAVLEAAEDRIDAGGWD